MGIERLIANLCKIINYRLTSPDIVHAKQQIREEAVLILDF